MKEKYKHFKCNCWQAHAYDDILDTKNLKNKPARVMVGREAMWLDAVISIIVSKDDHDSRSLTSRDDDSRSLPSSDCIRRRRWHLWRRARWLNFALRWNHAFRCLRYPRIFPTDRHVSPRPRGSIRKHVISIPRGPACDRIPYVTVSRRN